MKSFFRFVVLAYRMLLRPWLGQHCRFHPSCSEYALEALETHGSWQGLWLAIKRLSRCHPWHEGGVDPVPPAPQHCSRKSAV